MKTQAPKVVVERIAASSAGDDVSHGVPDNLGIQLVDLTDNQGIQQGVVPDNQDIQQVDVPDNQDIQQVDVPDNLGIHHILKRKRGRPAKNSLLACAVCTFETKTLDALLEHAKTHPDKLVFHCPHCHAMFSQKGNLQAHVRTHTKERPYTCTDCSFSAAQRHNLVVHRRKHTKEKPLHCDECDFATAQHANLRSHKLRKHCSATSTDGYRVHITNPKNVPRFKSLFEKKVNFGHHFLLSHLNNGGHFKLVEPKTKSVSED